MPLLNSSKSRTEKLSKGDVEELCHSLTESFDVKKIVTIQDYIKLDLERGVNRMRWVDGGTIKIRKVADEKYLIESSIALGNSILYYGFMFGVVAIFMLGTNVSGWIKLLIPIVLFLLLIGMFKFAIATFQMRVDMAINNITSLKGNISDEQREWINHPDRCPACGQSGVEHLDACPECGIAL